MSRRLLLLEQELDGSEEASEVLTEIGESSLPKRILKAVGVAGVSALIAYFLRVHIAEEAIKRHLRKALPAIKELERRFERHPRDELALKNFLNAYHEATARVINDTTLHLIAAFVVAVILLSIVAFRESSILEDDEPEKIDPTVVREKAKKCYKQVVEAFKKAVKVVEKTAKDLLSFSAKHKVGIGALLILVTTGIAILAYLKRRRVAAHTAIEALRSAGLTAKSPIVIGACTVGVVAIAAAVYLVYRRKRV